MAKVVHSGIPSGHRGCCAGQVDDFSDDPDVVSAIDGLVMAVVDQHTPTTLDQGQQIAPCGGAHPSGSGSASSGSNRNSQPSNVDANGHYADGNGKFPDANGHYPDAKGMYPDANGHYADANGLYPDANGRYADAHGRYPDANGHYADDNGNYPEASEDCCCEKNSGADVASTGANTEDGSDGMDYTRQQLMALVIPPDEIERIMSRLESEPGIGNGSQSDATLTSAYSGYSDQASSVDSTEIGIGTGPGKPGRSSLRIQGSQFGEDHHYRVADGVEEFKVATSDRQPGFWNMPRSEGAFLQDKFTSDNPHTFSADYAIKSGNGFCIAQLFNNSSNGHPQLMVMYKDGALNINGRKVPMPLGQKFSLRIEAGSDGTRVFVDNRLVSAQPLKHQGGDNYFRYGAYLQGRDKAVAPETSARVVVSGASVQAG